ncbi:cytochrome c oxidase subunit II [Salinisphaera sp.]|uniref:cytochrome c oxidase subunit II n=1 Tax=Salinisphaera sp. TaxID=1914330 RepID=UPI000C679AEE|nr:cytochrome c oxidase subunit II [Salinisphaera sp.]MBS64069.1 cytochrome c oxidase subunit II [Salinisphaera sp.]
MNKISILSRSGLVALGALAMSPAHAAWTLNMNEGVTDLTSKVFGLHMLIFWICVVIGIGVFGVMLYSVIVHRKSRGFEASHFHESTVVEIAWTIVPFIILIAVAIPAAGTLLQIEDSSNPDMTIRVTGHQWLWEYDYVDADVHFFSRLDRDSDNARRLNSGIDPNTVDNYLRNVDNPMVVPVDTKVRLLLTASDVIHSWWVPELGGKKDAIPGYINDMWFQANKTGVYRGQCAELCGRGHAFMPIVVKVVSQSDYDAWVREQGGNPNSDSELATGQPSTNEANAEAQTSADESATAGNATEARTEDGSTNDPQAAEESIVGTGESNNEGADDADQREAEASDDRGSPKVPDPDEQDQSSADDSEQDGSAATGDEMPRDALMSQGKEVYGNLCAACHQPDGSGMPAAGFPAMKGSAVATGDINTHIGQILNGKGAMPPYKGTLDDKQIAAVVTYERNAFGNDTGDVVQPSQVAAQR